MELNNDISQKIAGLNEIGVKAVETTEENRKLFEPGEPSSLKKARGRPKKKPEEGQKTEGNSQGAGPKVVVMPSFDARDGAKEIFKVVSAILVRTTKCMDMALMPEEIQGLGDSWGMVANKYMPNVLGQYGDIIIATTISASVAFRLAQVAELEIQKRQRAKAYSESAETVHQHAAAASAHTNEGSNINSQETVKENPHPGQAPSNWSESLSVVMP